MRIFDCFQFFDENMILDLRFNILNSFVSKFIVVESKYLHSGVEKKPIFDIVCSIANYLHLDSQLINRIKSKDLNQFAKRPFDSSLVVKKAKEEFGFSSSKLTHILKQIL